MTEKEVQMVSIFVAGRIAAKEKELGASDIHTETKEQQNNRIIVAKSEFIQWLYDVNSEFLPEESRKIVECSKIDTLLDGRKIMN